MLLSDRDILNRIERGEIVIDPFDVENLGSNSYDLHLDDTLKVYTDRILDAREDPSVEILKIPEDGRLLRPNRVYLGSTIEWTRTQQHVPRLEGKSSMARLGISVVSDGGFGDIDFQGCWTLELSVRQPVRVYPGMAICQISYVTTGPCDMPYSNRDSARYGNFRNPKEYTPPEDRSEDRELHRLTDGPDSKSFDHGPRIPVAQCDHAEDLPLPKRATPGSSAVDLQAAVDGSLTLEPDQIKLIDTGIKISLPEGWEAQVRARSGMASEGIIVPNGPGTIDSDYRGEIKVLLQNLSGEPFTVERGDRIAQLTVHRVQRFEWEHRSSLDETTRGEDGFGSTGIEQSIAENGNRTGQGTHPDTLTE